MSHYAVVDNQGNVTNIVLWEGPAGQNDWTPPAGETAVVCDGTTAYVGGTYLNGVFSAPPAPPPPTPAQQGVLALTQGIEVTCTTTPSLNGLYNCDQNSQAQVNAVVTYVLLNGNFPGNSSVMPWHDMNDGAHQFPDVATFKLFATAFANYVAAVMLYINSNGQMGGLPPNTISLP